jgi:hypothetical protein
MLFLFAKVIDSLLPRILIVFSINQTKKASYILSLSYFAILSVLEPE